ncbi:Uncharacterised protein [Sphingobacterium spiritivorum]|uniref:DUF4112 domain-containing protein n=1 Tax=Sphingobacterium spiritivorum TaxID=258 RepID=A0A380C8T8_SPHSI|nr:DUF4112 domain-containing protein [Sphingobacterium spiritivorum]SUJ15317.1 Uncharacterised protein [Sphingobacterium spiritivorum]
MPKILLPEEKELRLKQDFAWVERVSWILDNKFKIGGVRFGLDPLLNLIPFAGNLVTFSTSLMLVMVMWRNGVSSKAVVKMLINILIDAILGAIPFLGNIFDFFKKSNQRNVEILREHYYEGKHQGSGVWLVAAVLGILLLICGIMIFILWKLTEWIYQLIF